MSVGVFVCVAPRNDEALQEEKDAAKSRDMLIGLMVNLFCKFSYYSYSLFVFLCFCHRGERTWGSFVSPGTIRGGKVLCSLFSLLFQRANVVDCLGRVRVSLVG